MSMFDKSVKLPVVVSNEALVLQFVDVSSSRSVEREFPSLYNDMNARLAAEFPRLMGMVYHVSGEIEKITADPVSFADLPKLDPDRWYYGSGGVLKAGSALIDALIRAGMKTFQLRRSGYTKPISIILLSDGWSRLDEGTASAAKDWIDVARHYGAEVKFVVFTQAIHRTKIARYISEVGLYIDQATAESLGMVNSSGEPIMMDKDGITPLEVRLATDPADVEVQAILFEQPEHVHRSARDSMTHFEGSIRNTMMTLGGPERHDA